MAWYLRQRVAHWYGTVTVCPSSRVINTGGDDPGPPEITAAVAVVGVTAWLVVAAHTRGASLLVDGAGGAGRVIGRRGGGALAGPPRRRGRGSGGDINIISLRRWSASDLWMRVPGRGSLAGLCPLGLSGGCGVVTGCGVISFLKLSDSVPENASIAASRFILAKGVGSCL